MKADLPLSERRRIQAEKQREQRAAFVRRHTEVLDEQHAIEATQMALDVRGPEYQSMVKRIRG